MYEVKWVCGYHPLKKIIISKEKIPKKWNCTTKRQLVQIERLPKKIGELAPFHFMSFPRWMKKKGERGKTDNWRSTPTPTPTEEEENGLFFLSGLIECATWYSEGSPSTPRLSKKTDLRLSSACKSHPFSLFLNFSGVSLDYFLYPIQCNSNSNSNFNRNVINLRLVENSGSSCRNGDLCSMNSFFSL